MRTRDVIIGLVVLLAAAGLLSFLSDAPASGHLLEPVVVTAEKTPLSSKVDDHFTRAVPSQRIGRPNSETPAGFPAGV